MDKSLIYRSFVHEIRENVDTILFISRVDNVPLVDFTKDSVYGKSQVEIERGVFVITHSATKRKQEHLQNISDSLRLGWKVEIVTK